MPPVAFPPPLAAEIPAAGDPARAAPAGAAFSNLLAQAGSAIDRGEALVARAATGPDVSDASVLIALQVGVYRYTELVELASKVVEGASGAVRTTMQAT